MSYKLYPVLKNELQGDDYDVKINGKSVTLDTARVSAVPFNRRWPGHQRQIEQSEIVQFLSLSIDEPLDFEITPKIPFKNVEIRPKSLNINPVISDGKIKFTLEKPAYFTVEPYGRNHVLHIFADPMPKYEIDISDPNVIYFGKGEHDVGMLELKSNQTIFIDEGAVVYACIHAIDAENIRILGRGILDNSKNREEILFEVNAEDNHEAVNNAVRRSTVVLEYCSNIEIDGITIRDSLCYNIRPIGCEKLQIKHVKIIGCWRYNSDGIDMHNCRDVYISDCFIRTFDDSICVKGFDCFDTNGRKYEGDVDEAVKKTMYRKGRSFDVSKNILAENCVIWNDWGKALEIGAETRAEEICDITFRNCDIIHLTNKALDCSNVDYADVHDVTFTDINIEVDEIILPPLLQENDTHKYSITSTDYVPWTICLEVVFHHEYSAGGERRGKNRNILFKNISVFGDKMPKAKFKGYDDTHKTENVLISNLSLNGNFISELTGDNWNMGDFTENIRLEIDRYSQMDKNNVDSKGQLKKSSCVVLENPEGRGGRVMFVGNSMALHSFLPEIGWYGEWGMAASNKEKDYVHLLEKDIQEIDPDAAFCICQVAEWEREYKNGSEKHFLYDEARKFAADIIILRFIENVKKNEYDKNIFLRELDALVKHLDGSGKAKFIITTGFWRHPADNDILAYAEKKGIPCVELGDLGEDDQMKAIGLFEHSGVANHPGDEGMKAIAERIMAALMEHHYISSDLNNQVNGEN